MDMTSQPIFSLMSPMGNVVCSTSIYSVKINLQCRAALLSGPFNLPSESGVFLEIYVQIESGNYNMRPISEVADKTLELRMKKLQKRSVQSRQRD
ncbi:hypothetical protein L6164_032642 [Bauhinia variegata]|uniref:Uncharacterized protein n=1 Tax=Bauhinia variegata TaxID=167791 RepID=A0ACB9KPH0_BAUVA|nr:hypothetical protein L6164_032642 [Bauhinia variegata]